MCQKVRRSQSEATHATSSPVSPRHERPSRAQGLKITKFPYLLTIQLKRFDFDYATMHRIKLNDRMTFPDVLNLNPFIEKTEPAAEQHQHRPVDKPPGGGRAELKRAESDDEGICLEPSGAPSAESTSHR